MPITNIAEYRVAKRFRVLYVMTGTVSASLIIAGFVLDGSAEDFGVIIEAALLLIGFLAFTWNSFVDRVILTDTYVEHITLISQRRIYFKDINRYSYRGGGIKISSKRTSMQILGHFQPIEEIANKIESRSPRRQNR